MLQYLGYLYYHEEVRAPTLQQYMDPVLFIRYVAFLLARQLAKKTIKQHIIEAKKVLYYLRAKAVDHLPDFEAIMHWYEDLQHQLGQNMINHHRPIDKTPESLKLQGRWMDMEELVVIVERLKVAALQVAAPEPSDVIGTFNAAQQLHNAIFACFCVGHLPPLRASVIMSLTVPRYTGGCLRSDCCEPGKCKGNRLYWGEPAHDANLRELWCDIPHHKVSRAWGGQHITFRLPAELTELLTIYLEWAHTSLTLGVCDNDLSPTVFVNTTTGQPLKPQEVSQLFQRVVLKGTDCRFGVQMLRSIFVVDRRTDGTTPGPDEEAAAAVMGHNVAMWDMCYDKGGKARLAQQGVNGMDSYRTELLRRHKEKQQQQQQLTKEQQQQDSPVAQQRRQGQQQQPTAGSFNDVPGEQQPSVAMMSNTSCDNTSADAPKPNVPNPPPDMSKHLDLAEICRKWPAWFHNLVAKHSARWEQEELEKWQQELELQRQRERDTALKAAQLLQEQGLGKKMQEEQEAWECMEKERLDNCAKEQKAAEHRAKVQLGIEEQRASIQQRLVQLGVAWQSATDQSSRDKVEQQARVEKEKLRQLYEFGRVTFEDD